mmetsp:Transcript_11055/g.21598  ORF Transcript_11055/g.21598 Transcript_11055/m.21598 type:complete len:611 (+) Transcript_11055:190-2022(+)|eukprot:CAMPEP_0171501236 /NCGR_PEP_ID=MMETSP0958-20121227/9443_1 /TAXON_ID=87120 /ORGANISM="Aurantiochytrium limacinum, Strain ATCCMYA-1381" /LENGTH=610 /DNA_ID=CAMNT_0012036023 /DNA_START=37 /DNA_END=1869 /DNA_ORIENTATION=+
MPLERTSTSRLEAKLKTSILGLTRTAVVVTGAVSGRIVSAIPFVGYQIGQPVDLKASGISFADEDSERDVVEDDNDSMFDAFEMLGGTSTPGSRAGASALGYSGYGGLVESNSWCSEAPERTPGDTDFLTWAGLRGVSSEANLQDASTSNSEINRVQSEFSQQQRPEQHIPEPARSDPIRIVIVGGGFAGLRAKAYLDRSKLPNTIVTLIDEKEFFEYTPGILRALTKGGWEDLTRLYPRQGFVQGRVKRVDRDSLIVEAGGEFRVPFDYLVYAAGGGYGVQWQSSGVVKPRPPSRGRNEPLCAHDRWRDVLKTENDIADAKNIVFIGGGYVGVEWVAELAERYAGTNKRITLVDRNAEICKNMPPASRRYIESWLRGRGVELFKNSQVIDLNIHESTVSVMVEGEKKPRVLSFDLYFECKGLKPNTEPLYPVFKSAIGPDGRICVDDELNVTSQTSNLKMDNIFAVGDVASHKPSKPWQGTGLFAELQAEIACANIVANILGKPLRYFPEGATHTTRAPGVPQAQVVSLGLIDGSFRLENFVINGFMAAWLKVVIEETKLLEASGNPLGYYFWQMSEKALMLLWRTTSANPLKKLLPGYSTQHVEMTSH